MLTLLNSNFLEWRFRLTSTNNNVNNYELKAFPFPVVLFTTNQDIRSNLVNSGASLYYNKNYEGMVTLLKACLSAEPTQSDVVHDILAYLAQQMLDLNRQRQNALELFIIDLEGILTPAQMQKIGRLWTPDAAVSNPANPELVASRRFADDARRSARTWRVSRETSSICEPTLVC